MTTSPEAGSSSRPQPERRAAQPRLAFKLPLDPARLLRARHRISDYLDQHGVPATTIGHMVLAIEEAMTNAVRHSGAGADLEVRLDFRGRDLHAEVQDRGSGFDVSSFDAGRVPDPLEPGGRGLYLIARLMDHMDLASEGGLTVHMLKRDALDQTGRRVAGQLAIPDGGVLARAPGYREARERSLVEEVPEGFAALDWEYRFIYVNELGLRLYGLRREEVLGTTIWELFPHLDHTDLGEALRDAMELGVPAILEYESPVLARALEFRIYPTSSGVSFYLRDIQERKRRERERDDYLTALLDSEERFRSLFENMTEGVALHELVREAGEAVDYYIVDVNPAFERQTGLAARQVRGALASAAYGSGEAPYLAEYARVIQSGSPLSFETYFAPLERHFRITALSLGDDRFATVFQDITERKRAEQDREALLTALRESEQSFATIFEESPVAIALTKMPEGTVARVNKAFEALLGFSRDELIGRTSPDLGISDPASQRRLGELLDAQGPVRDYEAVRTTKSGDTRMLSLSVDWVTVGAERYVLTTVRDVTEQKRAEEALRDNERLLRAVIESTPDPIFLKDRESRYLLGNRAVLEIWGRSLDEVLGKSDRELYGDAEIAGPLMANDRVVLESGTTHVFEERIPAAGSLKTYLSTKTPYRDENGAIVGVVGIARDISERMRLQEELRRKEEQARHLVRFAPAAIYEIDFRRRRFVSVNDFMCEYSGYSREELLAMDPLELLGDEGGRVFLDRVRRSLAGETIEPAVEYRVRTKDGGERLAVLNVTPVVEDGSPVGAFVVAYDVTDRARTEREREELLGRLERELVFTRLLLKTAETASGSLSIEEVAGRVLGSIRDDVGDLRAGSIYLVDESAGVLRHLALFGYPEHVAAGIPELPLAASSNVGRAAVSGRLVTHDDGDEPHESAARRTAMGLHGTRWLAAPIRRGADTLGVMALFFREQRPFEPDELHLYQGVADILGAAMANAHLHEAQRVELMRTTVLKELAGAAASTLEPAELSQRVLAIARASLGAKLGAVYLMRGDARHARQVATAGYPADRLGELRDVTLGGDTLSGLAMASGEVQVALAGGEPPGTADRLRRLGAADQRLVALPVRVRGSVVGAVALSFPGVRPFRQDELELYAALADQLGLGLENARLYAEQQRIAATLQENFLHALPSVPGLELAMESRPATQPELVGGDFSDVFLLPDGQVALLIGDVAGKGVRAAGLTETVRSTVRAFSAVDAAPPFMLRKTNELLLRYDPDEPHVTAFLCVIDPRTGHVAGASAGHPPPVHLSPFSAQPMAMTFGPPLGTFPADHVASHLMLTPDDYLVLYTDGVTEARRDGELFGERRLSEVIAGLRGRPAADVARGVAEAAITFGGGLRDDLQVLVVRLA